jgi:hypothetical protein
MQDRDVVPDEADRGTSGVGEPDLREVAERLAQVHYRVEPGIRGIYALTSGNPLDRTIRLLEVNPDTIASGIVPVGFGAHPPSGIHFPSVIVEVTPREFEDVKSGVLPLPDGWRLGDSFARPTAGGTGHNP